jgi:hypothetical protein
MNKKRILNLFIISFFLLGLLPLPAAAVPIDQDQLGSASLVGPNGQGNGESPFSTQPATVVGQANSSVVTAASDVSLIVDDGSREDAVGLTAGGQFIWLNRFTPDPGEFPFALDTVEVLFGAGVGVNVGELVDIYVYEDTDGDGDPGTNANWLGSATNQTVQAVDDTTFSVYTLSPPVLLNGPPLSTAPPVPMPESTRRRWILPQAKGDLGLVSIAPETRPTRPPCLPTPSGASLTAWVFRETG